MKTVLKNWIGIFFSEKAVLDIRKIADFKKGLIWMILSTIIFIIPTNTNFSVFGLLYNFALVFACLFVLELFIYGIIFLMSGKITFKKFFGALNPMLAMSLIFVSLPAAIVSYFLFGVFLNDSTILNLFFSLIPYYNMVLFGWSAEIISGLRERKAVVVAIIAMSLLLLLNLLLKYIIV